MFKPIRLPFIDVLKENLSHGPRLIQVVLGPRQVGKTTGILHYLKSEWKDKFIYASADALFNATPEWVMEKWQEARRQRRLLALDEIQKVENWAEVVKKLWDEDTKENRSVPCILLGSSSLELHRGLSESLTGRFRQIRAHHWNYRESHEGYRLSFEEYLKFGGYPGSYPFRKDEQEWATYLKTSIIETVVEKDILKNHTVKSPALFKQAFELLISYPAQEISYTKLLGQLQDKGNTELVKYYLKLYEGAFLIRALDKFSTSPVRAKSSSPKILPLCPAFYYTHILEEYSRSERGRAFELVVGSQLNRLGLDLYYWRERNDEVDFVVKRGKSLWAIEVKSGREKSLKGLEAFQKKFPAARVVMITPENYFDFEKDPIRFLTA